MSEVSQGRTEGHRVSGREIGNTILAGLGIMILPDVVLSGFGDRSLPTLNYLLDLVT